MSGLVLAAGTSSRLGRPKPLLPFGETTVLGRVLARVQAAALDEIVVVLGAAAVEIRREVDLRGVTVAENPDFAEGCATSYRTGLEALWIRARTGGGGAPRGSAGHRDRSHRRGRWRPGGAGRPRSRWRPIEAAPAIR